MKINLSLTLCCAAFFMLSTPCELEAQPHCKLGWQVQPYFCDMDSLILTAYAFGGAEPYSYLWSTGETTVSIYALNSTPTTYSVTVTGENGCTASGSYTTGVNVDPYINGTPVSCENFPIYLDAVFPFLVLPPPGVTYLWSTGATTHNITVLQAGTYSVTFTDPANGCDFVTSQTVSFLPAPEPVITGPTQICGGQNITLTASGGPFNQYLWLPGLQSTESISVNTPGTYIVQVVGTNNCYGYDTITVTNGANLTLTGITTDNTSCASPNGAIDLTVSPTGSYTYLWSNTATTQDINNLAPGAYTVSVTAGGCILTSSFTIADNTTLPTLQLTPIAESCGLNNGAVNLTVTPNGSYTYSWSNGFSGQNLSNISSGTYAVTVTANNGCTSSANVQVTNNNFIPQITGTTSPNTSCSTANGSVNLTVAPAGTYSFTWSNGANTEDLNNVTFGTYTVTVTSGNTCTATAQFTVDNLATSPTIANTVIPSSCGENNGSITLQVSNGQAPYNYAWSNGNSTDGITNVPAGLYSVTVTASNGCSATASIDLPNVDPVITISGNITPNTSCSQSNGGIDISVSPAASYVYTWSNGAVTQDVNNLPAGSYSVTVTLGNTCSESADFIVTNSNIPFDISAISVPNTSCSSPNGSVNVTIIPAGTYTYLWSSGETTEDIQNLAAGNYTVTVTNIDGCAIPASFSIQNTIPTITVTGLPTNNTSCLVPNGTVDITISPAGSYSFQWSTGSTTEDLLNVVAGNYQVTVTNTDGCTTTSSYVVIDQSISFLLSAVPSDNNSCLIPDGSIDLTVMPAGNYMYQWSSGQLTEDLQFLQGGSYQVTVTDANSCTSTSSFIVVNATSNPVITATITPDLCMNNIGAIDLTTSPAENTFLWSTGDTLEDINQLPGGNYRVTVSGVNGCTTADTFTVLNTNNVISLSGILTDNTSCLTPTGALDLAVLPAGAYTYAWSTGATTEDLSMLGTGLYSVTVTDQSNCSSTSSFTIQSSTIDPVISDLISSSNCGLSNGSIDLSISPSNGNTFNWSNGSTSEDLLNVSAGTYSVTVTNNNGCYTTASYTVPDTGGNFSITSTVTDNQSCTAGNGAIIITISPASTYTFAWSNGMNTSTLDNLNAGTYALTITDQNGCTSSTSFEVLNQSQLPVLSTNVTPAACGQNNGSVDLNVTGTTNNTYTWSNGFTSQDLVNIASGNYQVTVTSEFGCTATANCIVPNVNSTFTLNALIADDSSCIHPSGFIDLTVLPIGNYSFSWSNGASNEDLQDLISGIYEVTVTDGTQCSITQVYTIENLTTSPVISPILQVETCGSGNGAIHVNVNPSAGNTFLWSTGDVADYLDHLSAGQYAVTVTDSHGCTADESFTLPASTPIEVKLNTDLTSVQHGSHVTCSLELNIPLNAVKSISWTPVDMMSCHDVLCLQQEFTLYTRTEIGVTVIDTNGCSGAASIVLDIEPDYKVYIPNVFSPNLDGPNDRFTVFTNEEVNEVVLLEIYDRWGNLVFVNAEFPPNEPNYGWDGYYHGQLMNPDVFAYRAVVRFPNGEEHSYKGDVTLAR